jgi:hypothetical protein
MYNLKNALNDLRKGFPIFFESEEMNLASRCDTVEEVVEKWEEVEDTIFSVIESFDAIFVRY